MRTAIPELIVALTLFGAGPALAEPERKIFIREIVVDRACISASPQALLAQIAQEVPRDVLARRGLRYEDLPAYLDVQHWNPERFDVRESKHILRSLRSLDMRVMLWLEVSCLPRDEGGGRYLLTGRLTDLDVMDRILSCPSAQTAIRGGRRMCHVGGDVFDAVSFTHVKMADFGAFLPAVRQLLARLLHIPEVSFASPIEQYDPGEEIEQTFLLRKNDGREPGYAGPVAPVRGYRLAQDVLDLPGDLAPKVCADPEQHWTQLRCGAGFAGPGCDAADLVRFRLRRLVHREVAQPPDERPGGKGGGRIAITAPPHAADYLIRAEAIAEEPGGEIASAPAYRCVHIATRTHYFGFASRVLFGYDPQASVQDFPSGLVRPGWGLDLLYVAQIGRISLRRRYLPAQALGLAFGITQLTGSNPCPTRDPVDCQGPVLRPLRFSTSYTLEVRGQLRTDLVRLWRLSPRLTVDLGMGLESLSTSPGFPRDGIHGSLLMGFAAGVGFHFGRAGYPAVQGQVAYQFQLRRRFDSTGIIGISGIDAPGVPDLLHVHALVFEALLAPPRRRP